MKGGSWGQRCVIGTDWPVHAHTLLCTSSARNQSRYRPTIELAIDLSHAIFLIELPRQFGRRAILANCVQCPLTSWLDRQAQRRIQERFAEKCRIGAARLVAKVAAALLPASSVRAHCITGPCSGTDIIQRKRCFESSPGELGCLSAAAIAHPQLGTPQTSAHRLRYKSIRTA